MKILAIFVYKAFLYIYFFFDEKNYSNSVVCSFFGGIGYLIGTKVPMQLFGSIDKNATVSTWEVFYYIISFLA